MPATMQKSLEAQGFHRVALPEIRLFDPFNTGNLVTLFQKKCKAGETIVLPDLPAIRLFSLII